MYNVILNEEKLETIFGVLRKGDVLETVSYDNVADLKEYLRIKYVEDGVKVRYRKIA